MTTTADPQTARPLEVPQVLLDLIHEHPANPRIDAHAEAEMVDSVRQQGVLDPLMVAPAEDGDGWVLIDGHRRLSAARQAGLTSVPVNPRYDLVTEAQQIEVMAVTGLQKEKLSAVEEAAAYEQLTLLGYDETAIAAATGFGVRRVRERMKINDLSSDVRTGVHAGQISLVDLEALDEFADDQAATTDLLENIGTPNFRQRVFAARSARDRQARFAELAAEFQAAGAVKVLSVPGGGSELEDGTAVSASGMHMFSEELREAAAHDGCLGYLVYAFDSYAPPRLVCTDASRHPRPSTPGEPAEAAESEWEKGRAAREQLAAERSAAAAARTEWIRDHLAGALPSKANPLTRAMHATLPALLAYDVPAEVLKAGASATTIMGVFAGWLADQIADALAVDPRFIRAAQEATGLLLVWDWLKTAGCPLSDVDVALRTELEVKHTELLAEGA